MKQLLQNVRSGETAVVEVPAPAATSGMLLVRNRASLVSAGTERTLVEFAERNLLQKAISRPDLVRQVMDKALRDGLLSTLKVALNRLDRPMPMGYSCAGKVIAVGESAGDFQVGDHVACCGFGYASHSEVVAVPHMLAAKVPSGFDVNLEHAAFATVGAIAMHGVRLSGAGLGDVVVVLGLGLIGQITVQLLRAAGCRVVAMDPVASRARLAEDVGAVVATSASDLHSVMRATPHGADAVLITAGSSNDGPVTLAAEVARDRAAVVAVGSVGLNLPRKLYYEKELAFRVSRSYGPGRYDPQYEEHGQDYPVGYVRWTEGRNLGAFLELLAAGNLNVESLISHRFAIEQAARAYELIAGKTGEPSLGVLITYPEDTTFPVSSFAIAPRAVSVGPVRVGLLGAGAFATGILLPALKASRAELVTVCARNGATAVHAGRKFGFSRVSTSETEVLTDQGVNLVVVCTRHNLHAEQVTAALRAGKHVFCEKPLCLSHEELHEITNAYYASAGCGLFVGYNRRFAPMTLRLKQFLDRIREPLVLHCRVNAGYIPNGHWVQDSREGGGRIVGEMCHFVDQLMFLSGSHPVRVQAHALPNNGRYCDDNIVVHLEFANGSVGTITYVANGNRAFSKERLEVFGGGASAVLDDFRRLEMAGHERYTLRSRFKQDKGHKGEWEAITKSLETGRAFPISFEELLASTLAVFAIRESAKTGAAVDISAAEFARFSTSQRGAGTAVLIGNTE